MFNEGKEERSHHDCLLNTEQKLKFSIKDSSSKCDQIRRKLRIWSHLPKKSLMKTSLFVQCKKRTRI